MASQLELRAALVCDALDSLGLRSQCLPGGLAPLTAGLRAAGPALPLETVVVDESPDVPYKGLLEALDAMPPGAVLVTSARDREDVALWGELLTAISLARGAAGAVCHGAVRDASQIRALGFPVFASGTVPYDINGRLEVVGHTRAITIGSVSVAPGDLVVADDDGVAIVPAAVAAEVVARVAAKARKERGFRLAVESGLPPSEAFERFGTL